MTKPDLVLRCLLGKADSFRKSLDILSTLQALSETWREKLFDEQIEKLRAKIKEDERKSLESKVTKYRFESSLTQPMNGHPLEVYILLI